MIMYAVLRTQCLIRNGILPSNTKALEYCAVCMDVDARDSSKHIDVIANYARSLQVIGFHPSFYDAYICTLPVMEQRARVH